MHPSPRQADQTTRGPGSRDQTWSWPLALTLLAGFYLALRLPALRALPLFNDEAVYLVRALHFPAMLFDWGVAGATFPDGKLLHELALAALARLPADPLITGRLLSVACGLGTALALAQIGRDALSMPRAGLLAGCLYALAPLAEVHDVLAVPDSMLTLLSALTVWASLRIGAGPRASLAEGLAAGGLVVLAALVKLPGLMLAATPVLAVAILPAGWGERRRRAPAALLAAAVAVAGYLVLRELGYGLAERHKLAGSGLDPWLVAANAGLAWDWALRYLPAALLMTPLGLLARGGARAGTANEPRADTAALAIPTRADKAVPAVQTRANTWVRPYVLFLLVAGLGYVAGFVVIGQTLYSRYLLPAWPALLLAAAVGAGALWARGGRRRWLAALLVGLAVVWGVEVQAWLVFAPQRAPLAAEDRFQYVEGWSAGQGYERLAADLRAAARARPGLIVVSGAEIRLGNLAPQVALGGAGGARLEQVDLARDDAPAAVAALGREGPLALVVDAATAATYRVGERFAGLSEARRYTGTVGGAGFVMYVAGPPAEFFVPE